MRSMSEALGKPVIRWRDRPSMGAGSPVLPAAPVAGRSGWSKRRRGAGRSAGTIGGRRVPFKLDSGRGRRALGICPTLRTTSCLYEGPWHIHVPLGTPLLSRASPGHGVLREREGRGFACKSPAGATPCHHRGPVEPPAAFRIPWKQHQTGQLIAMPGSRKIEALPRTRRRTLFCRTGGRAAHGCAALAN